MTTWEALIYKDYVVDDPSPQKAYPFPEIFQ